LAGISWMLAMSRFEISYAYPWIGLNFLLMLFFGVVLFDESFSLAKLFGTLLIVAGIAVLAGN
jgi:multidrug transporter EmrE-like cation transporter